MRSDDRRAIEQTIQTYLDGLYEGDADKLASVFHETSALTYEQDGRLTVLPRAQWLQAVRERPAPKAKGLPRDDVILLVDQSGPTTAFVKFKCQIPPRFFTDYLSLLKIDGRWVVAQKVFATELRPQRSNLQRRIRQARRGSAAFFPALNRAAPHRAQGPGATRMPAVC
jgi:hypothetical protein